MKKLTSIILSLILLLGISTNAWAAETPEMVTNPISPATIYDNVYCMATYFDENFYLYSTKKDINLEKYCVEIAFRCICDNNNTDNVRLVIQDVSGNGAYNKDIIVNADGSSHSQSLYLPAGNYKVYLVGTGVRHIRAAVNFYAFN